MLGMKWKVVVDFLCGPRRRIPYSAWFLLLFTAGSLVLFIYQQDLSEMIRPLSPVVKLGGTPQQPKEQRERGKSDNYWQHEAEGILSSPVSPMQFPHFEVTKQTATHGSREQDIGSHSKRQRKLLKTTFLIQHNLSSSLSNSTSVFSQKLTNITKTRKQLIKEMCAKYKSNISKTITRNHVKQIFVEDKYKLLYCQVPKVGCSNWKRTLMVLAGKATNAQSINHDVVHNANHLRKLDSFDQEEIMYRLKTYTKIIFVREPLERLVSAYRDKFENPNDYYHSLFGIPIVSKYRKNPSELALTTGNGVTFKEFIQYLLDVNRPVGMDIHWEQVNQLCNPCLIDYDFIGKFENMNEESSFALQLIGAPSNIALPSFKDRNPTDKRTSMHITEKYFSEVSMLEKQRVYDLYYMDYVMFNYSKPFSNLY